MGRERLAVGLLLLVVLVVFFHAALVPGHVLSGADEIFTRPFLADVAPASFTHPRNELLFDAVYQFAPWRRFACASLRAGTLPLWNPYSACGTPLVATMQSAVFYPVSLLLCALPFESGAVWGAVLRLWIAGFATYLLARRYDLGVAAALLSGVSFMLCGFLIVWLEHPHTNVAIWLPALVLAAEHLLRAPTTRAALGATGALALMGGVQLTGGHIETSVNVLAFLGLYCLLRWWQIGPAAPVTRLGLLALAVVLAVGLAAMQLVPFFEWLPLSAELRRRTAGPPIGDPRVWRHLLALPLLVFPNLYGNPTWHAPYHSFLPSGNYNEQVLYVGTATLLLAVVALAARPWRPMVLAWALLGALAAAMMLSLPPFAWLNRLPGLALAHPERLRLIVSFALCLLAGFGAAAVLDDPDGRPTRLLRRCALAIVLAGVLLAAGANAALPRAQARIVAWGRALATQRYAELAHHARPLEYHLAEVDRLAEHLSEAFAVSNLAMYAPALWAGALLLALALARTRRARGIVLVTLVAADLVLFGQGYHPALPRAHLYPPTPLTARLAADPGLHRFTVLEDGLLPDAHMTYGLADVRGLDFRTAWYDDYLALLPDRIRWIDYGVILASTTSPLLRVLNLAYVAGADAGTLRGAEGLDIIAETKSIALGRVPRFQPRSYMVYDAVAVASDADALVRLRAEPGAVYDRAVLVAPSAAEAPPALAPSAGTPSADVTLVEYAPHEARWRVHTDRPGYLITTDAWYPGWTAMVDAQAVPVFRANGAFRAVHVPAGEHVVGYRYAPRSVRIGFAVTLASALAIAALLAVTRRSRVP